MSIEWKDVTRYSLGERNHVLPRTWEAMFGTSCLVIVTKYVGYGDEWVLHCQDLNISTEPLATDDLWRAKSEAIRIVKQEVERRIAELTKALHDLEDN